MRLFIVSIMLLFSVQSFADEMPEVGLDGLMKEIKSHNAKTMVVFWAPWCPYCMRELKIIRDNPQFISNNNLQLIGLVKRKDKKQSIRFVKREKMNFKFLVAKQEIYDKLQRIDAVPLTLVYDNKGNLLDSEYGKQDIEDLALMLED